MASANNYPTADFPPPSGISLDKFSIKHDTARNALTCSLPVLLQSVYELATPVDDQFAKTPGGKKYSVGLAIPKTALPMLKELKAKSDALMAADGVKGPYPSAIKDGGSQDGNGLFVKAGGAWSEWYYFTAKSKRPPVVTRKEQGQVIEVPLAEAQAGTWALVLFDLIAISYGGQGGAGGKRGTSAWMSRIHLLGGGKVIQTGGRSDDSDFLSMVEGSGSGADSAGGTTAEALF